MEPTPSLVQAKRETNEFLTEHIESRQSVNMEIDEVSRGQINKMNQFSEGQSFKFEEDSAMLGKKKIWKPDEFEKEKNKKIEKSRKLTSKATADTLELYNTMKERNQNKLDNYRQIYEQEKAPWDQQKEMALKRIDDFKALRLEKRMLTTAYVKTHFSELMDIVESYNEMKDLAKREKHEVLGERDTILADYRKDQDHKKMLSKISEWEAKMDQMNTYKLWLDNRIAEISGPLDILTDRMKRYLARNRLDMNGNILKDDVQISAFTYNDRVDKQFSSIESQIQKKAVNSDKYDPEQLYNARNELIGEIVNHNNNYISELEVILQDENYVAEQDKSVINTGVFLMNSRDRVKNIRPLRKYVKDIERTISFYEERLEELSKEKGDDPLKQRRQKKEIQEELFRAKRQFTSVKTTLALAEAEGKLLLSKTVDEKKAALDKVADLWSDYVRCHQRFIKEHQPLTGTMGFENGIRKISAHAAMDSNSDFKNQVFKNNIMSIGRRLPKEGEFWELAKMAFAYGSLTHYMDEPKEEMRRLKELIRVRNSFPSEVDNITTDKPAVKELIAELDGYLNKLQHGPHEIPYGEETSFVDQSYYDKYSLKSKEKITEYDMVLKQNSKTQQESIVDVAFKDMIMWEEITPNTPLFAHEPTINDLRQSKSTMSYITAATTGLINLDPQIIKNCIHDNGDGTVTVRLYEPPKTIGGECKPRYIRILKRVPMLKTGEALFTDGPYWMQLIERAAAAVGMFREGRQGYQSLEYGRGDEWITILTGATGGTLFARDSDVKPEENESYDDIFEKLKNAAEDKCIYHATTREDAADKISGHAFTVLGVKELNNQRFVTLRNPFVNMMRTVTENDVTSDSAATVDDTYGQFDMPFEEFMKTMQTVTYSDMNKAFP
ncbi:MAG: hypothetical protein K6E91_05970 [Butyrivibrio sp.]|nr:hypothetical protein [Butyrivibrio sp.]